MSRLQGDVALYGDEPGRCLRGPHPSRAARDVLRGGALLRCARTKRYCRSRHCVHCTKTLSRARKERQSLYALAYPGRTTARVLNALRLAAGGVVSLNELVEAAWLPSEDNEPDWAAVMVRRAVFDLRESRLPDQDAPHSRL